MIARRIFMSYSRKDKGFVTAIGALLKATGSSVFRDEESIPAGQRWRAVIEANLKAADAVFVFWTANAAASVEVKNEYLEAQVLHKDIIPILLDDTPLVAPLLDYQGVDFRPFVVVQTRELWHRSWQSDKYRAPLAAFAGLFFSAIVWKLALTDAETETDTPWWARRWFAAILAALLFLILAVDIELARMYLACKRRYIISDQQNAARELTKRLMQNWRPQAD